MRARTLCRAVLLFAACVIFSQPSMAQGRGHAFGKQKHDRAEFRGSHDARGRGIFFGTTPAGRPPGWDRGRKVGWGNCDVPPGQAKKFGCSGFAFRERVHPTRRVIFIP